MLWRSDEHEFVEEDDDGLQSGILRLVGEDSKFRAVSEDVIGNVAAESPFDGDSNHWVETPEFGENGQQIEHREFVGGDHKLALLQFTELRKGFGGFRAQIDQLFSVFVENLPGIGENAFP